MTAFLWSIETLARLCGHQDPEVKCWAADRMPRLYPKEAGPLMIELLSDRNGSVAAQAAAYFCDDPDRNFADALLAAFRKSSGISARHLAHALALMKDGRLLDAVRDKYSQTPQAAPADFTDVLMNVALLGTDESQRYVEDALRHLDSFGDFRKVAAGAFFSANLAAGTDIGKLLLFSYHSGVSGYVPALLAEIVNRAGAWCSVEDLIGKGQAAKSLAGEVEASLDLIAGTGYAHTDNTIVKLLKKRRFGEILEEAERIALAIREEKRLERGEEAYLRWQAGRDVPFFHCAVLTALKTTVAEMPAAQRETAARIAIIVLAMLAESRSLIALNPETLDADAAIKLFYEDRPDAPQDDAIMDLLAKRADVKSLAREAVRRMILPFAQANGRIIRFAGRFIDEGLARELLAVDFDDNGFEDDVAAAVGRLGPLSIPLLRSFFPKNDPAGIPLALRVLEDLPTEEAVDLILAHWPLLWSGYREWLLDAVTCIGDKRFIPALKIELREGEQAEGEAFCLLCLINGAADPELERIKREMALREEKEERLQGAMEKEDMGAFLREPLEIPLKCRSCRNVYHYTVGKVFVAVGTEDTVIKDRIVCKKCGALDHYEITEEGIFTVTARLALLTCDPETVKLDRDEMTVIPIRSMSSFGKEIPLQDLVDKYEKKLRKNPESPELLIGFANALRQIKRREDSMPFYERAIRNDPLAVEGHVSLGEYRLDTGDLESAFSHYSKAAEIMDRGHYYRVRTDLDQFKEGLLDMLMSVAERLGRKLPHPGGPRPGGAAPVPAQRDVGRNHPCPCGSGKKYKKCCLLKEPEQGPAPAAEPGPRKPPAPDPVFRTLRVSLSRYAEKEEFRKDFLRASGIFWNIEPREPIMLPERASGDEGQFYDWFIHDYRTAKGKTILEGFCDRRLSTLSAEERRLAESLLKSYLSIYEVQDVREGEGLTIRDVFTDEEMHVEEVSGSYEAVKWDLLQVRVYKMDGVCRFGGNGQTIPRMRLEALKAHLDNARRTFEANMGRAGWPAFLKENAFLIGRFFDEVVEEPPVLLTEERHRIISSKARFTVSDYESARKLLSGEYDFANTEEIPSGGVRFSWLKRGLSKAWEMGPAGDEKGMVATTSIVHPSGQLTFTVLGTVNLHPDRLILECMSRERLERGKKRLLDLLRGVVRHRIDEFEDIHVAMERREGKGEEVKPLKNEEADAMLASMMQKYMFAWLDKELPALGGKPPREAVKTKAGRKKVLDLIKDLENGEARKKKAGKPFIDLGPLRRELGIGRDEG